MGVAQYRRVIERISGGRWCATLTGCDALCILPRGAIGRVTGKHQMVWSKPLDEMRKALDGTRRTIGWFIEKHRDRIGGQSRLMMRSIGIDCAVNRD